MTDVLGHSIPPPSCADQERLLSTVQMAGFVRDGYLRFDEIIPRGLCGQLMDEIRQGVYAQSATRGMMFSRL